MRFSAVAIAASLSSVALAQQLTERQLGSLPQCAQSCVTGNFQGCKGFDIACICGKQSLIADLSCCVSKSCDAADTQATINFAQQLCLTYHITVPTVAGCTGAAATDSVPAATGSGSNSASTTGSAPPASSSGSGSGSGSGSSSPSASNTGSSGASSSPSGSKSSSPSGSASAAASTNLAMPAAPAQSAGAVVGMCAAAVVGLVAML